MLLFVISGVLTITLWFGFVSSQVFHIYSLRLVKVVSSVQLWLTPLTLCRPRCHIAAYLYVFFFIIEVASPRLRFSVSTHLGGSMTF